MATEFTITESDYVNAAVLAGRASRKQSTWLLVAAAVLLAVAVLDPLHLRPTGLCGLLCGIFGYYGALHVITPWQARKAYRNYKAMHGGLLIDIKPEGFWVATKTGENLAQWQSLLKWRENHEYLLAYIAPKLFYIVPKRIAGAGFDVEELRRVLRSKVGNPV
ncbi:YcxB family protein [Geomonas sp.]|uniref:YcxB family protein n=1 Tax=Geomonas sp. TaxID=2651584 RepID=UPI002B46B3EC|nr:YcxB family protein [Geomonas sp.]HJV36627.1 YcxB family protein [Geomonas sp.]